VGSLTVSLATRVRGRLQGIVGRPIPWNPLSPEDVRKFQGIFQRPKFFIFGHARSGTTLLARLVRLHPDVHCNWQGRFVTHYGDLLDLMTSEPISQWLWHHSNHWREGISSEVALARAVIETIMEMEANRLGKSIVGDKTPNLRNAESVRRAGTLWSRYGWRNSLPGPMSLIGKDERSVGQCSGIRVHF